jgi:glucose-6-phosphate 1-dehydrogenase
VIHSLGAAGLAEDFGVGKRGGFYESAGCLRAGKHLAMNAVEVRVQLHAPPQQLFDGDGAWHDPEPEPFSS